MACSFVWSPLPDSSLAGQEHGRTIPLADVAETLGNSVWRSTMAGPHTMFLTFDTTRLGRFRDAEKKKSDPWGDVRPAPPTAANNKQ